MPFSATEAAETHSPSERHVIHTVAGNSSVPLVAPAAVPQSGTPAVRTAVRDDQTTREELVASLAGSDPELYADIIRAAAEIASSTDRRIVLSTLLERRDLSYDNLSGIIQATRTMDSDTERRLVITRAVEHPLFVATSAICPSFVAAIGWMESATEQRLVLTAALEARQWSTASLTAMLRTLSHVDSDIDRRMILLTMVQHQRMNADARAGYVAAAREIRSDAERGLALRELAVTRDAPPPPPAPTPARTERAPRSERATEVRRGGESQWDSNIREELDSDGRRRNIAINAKRVFFGSARWDIMRIGPGGELMVEERAAGRVRRVRAVAGEGGHPVFTYTVDGRATAFDAGARRWMNGMIREFTGS